MRGSSARPIRLRARSAASNAPLSPDRKFPLPKRWASSANCSNCSSPARTPRKVWPPMWTSGRRSSKGNSESLAPQYSIRRISQTPRFEGDAMATAAQLQVKPGKLFIGGKWVDAASGKTFPTYNPATGEVLAKIAEGDREDIDRAVKAARKAFDTGPWSKMTASERGRLIWKLGDLLEQHLEEFALLESLDNGKPLGIARAADVPLAVDLFRYMAGWATKIEGNTIPLSVPYTPGARYLSYTLREPVGVVGQIIPWNFPLLMAAWKL